MSDPSDILAALREAGVRFVIVGGFAMIAHGASYLTEDLDIVYAREEESIEALLVALRPLRPQLRVAGEQAGLPFVFDATTLRNGMNFTLTTTKGDLDLMGEILGVGQYREVSASAEFMTVGGAEYEILSLEGLIRAKRAAGRPKDRQALPELEHLLEIQRLQKDEL
jgi:predicted nucleotidyltransferase